MVKLSHLEVEILQGGDAVRGYEDQAVQATLRNITRYIEIKEGQQFVILFARDQGYDFTHYDTFEVSVSIDGRRAGNTILPNGCMREGDGRFTRKIEGFWKMLKGREVLQEFRFEEAKLRSVRSSEKIDDLRERFADQGTICVEVSQCLGDFVSDDGDNLSDADEDIQSAVPKDIVKEQGSTSRASFNIIERPDTCEGAFVIAEQSFVAKFRFKYRTIEALYDQQVVPRPEKDTATLRTELEALQRDYDELKQKLKQEEADKFAGSSKKRKVLSKVEPGEIVLVEERPAHRRKPNTDDVMIELDD